MGGPHRSLARYAVSDGRIAWAVPISGLHVRLNRRVDRLLGCQKFPPLVVSLLAFPRGA